MGGRGLSLRGTYKSESELAAEIDLFECQTLTKLVAKEFATSQVFDALYGLLLNLPLHT